jgi:hypothetical protein
MLTSTSDSSSTPDMSYENADGGASEATETYATVEIEVGTDKAETPDQFEGFTVNNPDVDNTITYDNDTSYSLEQFDNIAEETWGVQVDDASLSKFADEDGNITATSLGRMEGTDADQSLTYSEFIKDSDGTGTDDLAIKTTDAWGFGSDGVNKYNYADFKTALKENLNLNVSSNEFKKIDKDNDTFVNDLELYNIEGYGGDGNLTKDELTKDTDTALTSTTVSLPDYTKSWNFDGTDADGIKNGKKSNEKGEGSDDREDKETYTLDELKKRLSEKLGFTPEPGSLEAALKKAGWSGQGNITDAMLRNLEGGGTNGILTVDELTKDTDASVTTSKKPTSFDYKADNTNTNTVQSLSAQLEKVLGGTVDIDDRGLAIMLGLSGLDVVFNDDIIKNKLDSDKNGILSVEEIRKIQADAAEHAKKSKLVEQKNWDYNFDTETKYDESEFASKFRKMGFDVDTKSNYYKHMFKDKNASDAEIKNILDNNDDGVITRAEASRLASKNTVMYNGDGKSAYNNLTEIATDIYTSLYNKEPVRSDKEFQDILEKLKKQFTPKSRKDTITDEEIQANGLDKDGNGIIDNAFYGNY